MGNKRLVGVISVLFLITLLIAPNVFSLPSNWDWRNVHGENWITPGQRPGGIGACAEFAFVDSFESQINVYYNQHLDLDLSEQMKIDCKHGTGPLSISSRNMLVDEACSFFANRDIYCNGQFQSTQEDNCCNLPYLCNNWQVRTWKSLGLDICDIPPYSGNKNCLDFWDFDSEEKIKQAEDEVKKLLITKGPIDMHISGMRHSMLLIGYKEDKSDWKTIQMCNSGTEMCIADKGCVPRACSPGENDISSYNFDPYSNKMMWLTYSCKEYENTGVFQWTMTGYGDYPSSEIPDNTCDPLRYGYSTGGIFYPYLQHDIGEGDTIWIFRNSIGSNIIEQALDVRQFGVLTIPSGPFVPPDNNVYWPINFDNNVRCYDKDNDGYCNWGVSDIGLDDSWRTANCPSSCNNKPVKDCNDADSSLGPFDESLSCTKIFCNDSDGIDYYTKGFVFTNYNGQDSNLRIYDNCQVPDPTGLPQWNGIYSCSGSQCKIMDFYCQDNKGPYGSFENCPYGCIDGACLPKPKIVLTRQKTIRQFESKDNTPVFSRIENIGTLKKI